MRVNDVTATPYPIESRMWIPIGFLGGRHGVSVDIGMVEEFFCLWVELLWMVLGWSGEFHLVALVCVCVPCGDCSICECK